MSLTGDTFDFQQGNVVTSSAQIVDNGATVGDVLTVQADKSIAAAPGGGSQPVSALLGIDNGINLAAAGSNPLLWDVLYDDWTFGTTLVTIPTGLGLSFVFDGSDAAITATASGVWAFTLNVDAPPDATFAASTRLAQTIAVAYLPAPRAGAGTNLSQTLTATLPMASGDVLTPTVVQTVAPTASPYTAFVYLQIVRLA